MVVDKVHGLELIDNTYNLWVWFCKYCNETSGTMVKRKARNNLWNHLDTKTHKTNKERVKQNE